MRCRHKPREHQGFSWSHQVLEEVRKNSSLEPPEGAWPCQHLDFGPPEQREDNFLLFEDTMFVVICCGSPRKLIQIDNEH